jgi:sugar O-acyltransferase (sialic acid O-acetyltransferase NeuD family)
MKKILIVGTGGLARELTAWCSNFFHIIGYTGTNENEHALFSLKGNYYTNDVTPSSVGTEYAIIAIGNPLVKARFYNELTKVGFKFPSFIHPSSVVAESADIYEGVIICPNCVISPNVTLKKLSYVNFSCGIGHDTIVGDFTQINPGVQLGGFTVIGEKVLIGSGAYILQGVSVGNGAIIGSGSVVFSKVSESVTMMGNPAKRMRAFEK